MILIFSAGIARLLKYPINWAIDLSTCLFAWSCFLSGDIAWREDKLMCVDVFVKLFPEKVKRYFKIFNYIVIMGFSVYLILFGIQLSYTTRERTFQGIPNFSYTWVTLSLPVGAVFLFMTGILKIRRDFRQNDKTETLSGRRRSIVISGRYCICTLSDLRRILKCC